MMAKRRAAIPRRLRDSEGCILLDCRLLFLDAANVAPTRAAMQHAGEFGEFGGGADGVDFDAPVVEIAGIPGEAKLDGGALGEVAIADALHAPADDPSFGVGWLASGFGHRQVIV